MAAKQPSTKRTSLMRGNDSDNTQLDEKRLESNDELMKLFPMRTQADRIGGLRVCGDSKTKSGLKPKQLVT